MFTVTNSTLGLVLLLALLITVFGCIPTVYVEPTNAISFEQMVTLDATIGARVEAHNLAGFVRGDAPSKSTGYLEPMRLPEAFNATGLEGTRAHEFHLGYAAARLIRQYYAALHPNGLRIESDSLVDVIHSAEVNSYYQSKLYPFSLELVDVKT